jgi:hypothetical protein
LTITVEKACTFPMARSSTGTVFFVARPTMTGGGGIEFFAFPLEQAEAQRVKRSNPKTLHGIFILLPPTRSLFNILCDICQTSNTLEGLDKITIDIQSSFSDIVLN